MDSPLGSEGDSIKEKNMSHTEKGDGTMQVARIGLDIAKTRVQVHGVDGHGRVMMRKQK
jgi:hypothetical protein